MPCGRSHFAVVLVVGLSLAVSAGGATHGPAAAPAPSIGPAAASVERAAAILRAAAALRHENLPPKQGGPSRRRSSGLLRSVANVARAFVLLPVVAFVGQYEPEAVFALFPTQSSRPGRAAFAVGRVDAVLTAPTEKDAAGDLGPELALVGAQDPGAALDALRALPEARRRRAAPAVMLGLHDSGDALLLAGDAAGWDRHAAAVELAAGAGGDQRASAAHRVLRVCVAFEDRSAGRAAPLAARVSSWARGYWDSPGGFSYLVAWDCLHGRTPQQAVARVQKGLRRRSAAEAAALLAGRQTGTAEALLHLAGETSEPGRLLLQRLIQAAGRDPRAAPSPALMFALGMLGQRHDSDARLFETWIGSLAERAPAAAREVLTPEAMDALFGLHFAWDSDFSPHASPAAWIETVRRVAAAEPGLASAFRSAEPKGVPAPSHWHHTAEPRLLTLAGLLLAAAPGSDRDDAVAALVAEMAELRNRVGKDPQSAQFPQRTLDQIAAAGAALGRVRAAGVLAALDALSPGPMPVLPPQAREGLRAFGTSPSREDAKLAEWRTRYPVLVAAQAGVAASGLAAALENPEEGLRLYATLEARKMLFPSPGLALALMRIGDPRGKRLFKSGSPKELEEAIGIVARDGAPALRAWIAALDAKARLRALLLGSRALAASDREAAVAFVMQARSLGGSTGTSVERLRVECDCILACAELDVPLAVRLASELPEGPVRTAVRPLVGGRLLKLNPASARELLTEAEEALPRIGDSRLRACVSFIIARSWLGAGESVVLSEFGDGFWLPRDGLIGAEKAR